MADEKKTLDDYPKIATRVVRHGLFWYYVPEEQVINGEEKVTLVQHTAFSGEAVDVYLNSDMERAEKHGALYSEAESGKLSREPLHPGAIMPETDEELEEVEIAELDDQELVEWLQSTGAFDGEPKPNATQVIQAAGDDKALAQRLMAAEASATGNESRKAVEAGLQKVLDRT